MASETIDLSTLVTALESLLTLADNQRRREEGEDDEARAEAMKETEAHIRLKLVEIHSRLKNGAVPWDEDEDMVDSETPSCKMPLRQRAESLAMAANPPAVPGPRLLLHGGGDDDEEGEDDEGTVSDPSPSPQVQNAGASRKSSSSARKGPAKESARAIVEQCTTVFDPGHGFQSESKALAAQLMAELAKTDVGRAICLRNENIIRSLSQVLGPDCPLETAVQVCRILANLCYDCAEGRSRILSEEDCLKKLVEIAKVREYRAKACGEDPGQRLPAILPGFLLNFCNGTPDAIHAVGRLGFLEVVAETVLSTETNDAVFNNCLLFLNCLADEKESHAYLARCESLTAAVCHVMRHTTSPEVTESVLELVQGMSVTGLIAGLAKSDLCRLMIELVEGRWEEHRKEFEDHTKTALNLLVLILSDDEAMRCVFEGGDKSDDLVDKFIDWIRGDDEELVVCGCLCVGNFACSERNTRHLVERKEASGALIGSLSSSSPSSKVVLASLSALKNLMVAKCCRERIVGQGLLDPCVKLLLSLRGNLSDHGAVTKLLSILRLAVEGPGTTEAAAAMTSDMKVVGKLVGFSANGNAPNHVQSESTRLLASLLKRCRSKEVVLKVVECGGMPQVVLMLHSRHVVMMNEALVALTVVASLLAAQGAGDVVAAQLHTDAVINAVKACLANPDHPDEVKSNAAAFVEALLAAKTEAFRKMLRDMKLAEECLAEESLEKLPQACRRLAEALKEEGGGAP